MGKNFKYQLGCGCACEQDCSEPCILLQNGTKEEAFEIIQEHYENYFNNDISDYELYVYSNELGYVNTSFESDLNESSLNPLLANIDSIETLDSDITALVNNSSQQTFLIREPTSNELNNINFGRYYTTSFPQNQNQIQDYINSLDFLMKEDSLVSVVRCKKLTYTTNGYGYKALIRTVQNLEIYASLKSVDWEIIQSNLNGTWTNSFGYVGNAENSVYDIAFTPAVSSVSIPIYRPAFCLTTGAYNYSCQTTYENYSRDSVVGNKTYSGTLTKTANITVVEGLILNASVSVPITMTINDDRDYTDGSVSDRVVKFSPTINLSSIIYSLSSSKETPVLSEDQSGNWTISFYIEPNYYNLSFECEGSSNTIIYIEHNDDNITYKFPLNTTKIQKDFGITLPSLGFGKSYYANLVVTEEEIEQFCHSLFQQYEAEYGEDFICKIKVTSTQNWYCILPKNICYDSIEQESYLTNIYYCN